jgi:toxin ParE1/3/4
MSAPEFCLELTEPAEADFRDLLSFTLRTWGEGQFAEYKRRINDALNAVAGNPRLGHERHGIMVYHAGRHRIFYRVQGTTIYVLRILHDRMDAVRHLPEN